MAPQLFLVRQNDETSVWALADGALVKQEEMSGLPAGAAVVSKDGSYVAVAGVEEVILIRLADGQRLTLPVVGANMLDFSPDA